MIKSYRVILPTNTIRQIVRESEPVSVRLNFRGLTTEVFVGGETVSVDNGFPLQNEDFKYRNWEFVVLPGTDKFSAINPNEKPITVNVLVMSLPAGSVAMTGNPPTVVPRISSIFPETNKETKIPESKDKKEK